MKRMIQPIFVVLLLSLLLAYTTNAGPTPPGRSNIVVDPNDDSPWEELSSTQDNGGADVDQQMVSWSYIDNLVFYDIGRSILTFRVIINRNFISFYYWDIQSRKDEISNQKEVRPHR